MLEVYKIEIKIPKIKLRCIKNIGCTETHLVCILEAPGKYVSFRLVSFQIIKNNLVDSF